MNIEEMIGHIRATNIEVTLFSSDEVWDYKEEWFKKFIPADRHKDALNSFCLSNGGFLWHAFSYKILNCVEGDDAKIAFNEQAKNSAVLLDNSSKKAIAYCIDDISIISAEEIDALTDVILTDLDFGWTYAKTHEVFLGPYFYKKIK